MSKTLIWIIAVVVTIATVIYQRKTGPTYPVATAIEIGGQLIETSLPRSHGGDDDMELRIQVPDNIDGKIVYKRFKTPDPLDTVNMVRQEADLVAYLPHQPPAGKLEYSVILEKDGSSYSLNPAPIVARFKGSVPAGVLIPHILFIFIAQLLSLVAGLFALFKLSKFKLYSWLTVIFLFVGGFVLGPVIQKYAFGALWTGFPFGQDLTDNKVLFAMIFWIFAIVMNIKKERPKLVILASVVFFLVNMIPHSLFGSEMDYESGEVIQGMILLF
ncbi:hypothetical protein ACFLSP_00600 [Bacteroidota bacterium]